MVAAISPEVEPQPRRFVLQFTYRPVHHHPRVGAEPNTCFPTLRLEVEANGHFGAVPIQHSFPMTDDPRCCVSESLPGSLMAGRRNRYRRREKRCEEKWQRQPVLYIQSFYHRGTPLLLFDNAAECAAKRLR